MLDEQKETPDFIIKAAFATDNGKNFISRHFGDAKFFDIYSITENNSILLKRVVNRDGKENNAIHADEKKAKSISKMLQKYEVNTAVSRVYGPNFKRICKKFVCLVIDDIPMYTSIKMIQDNYKKIQSEWDKGENRNHISLKNKR
ncbi:MAG: dinitrogenase iron-molybdenum cofactor biosynthesis protein [Spirochaetia bacterium]|nr:dinitrogenase iron-molybdenum cofactor biosynthesis protein [Spirochaetia bacterium]